MPRPPAVPDGYPKLLSALRCEVARGIKEAERLLERQKVCTYWAVGRLINSYLTAATLERGDIGAFYRRLSVDLNISGRTLQHAEQFYRYFPKNVPWHPLSWSQYRELLAVTDEKERARWIRDIVREQWTTRELGVRLADALGVSGAGEAPAAPGTPGRGDLYTYRLVRGEGAEWMVDIGFTNRIEAPPCDGILDNKYLVNSVKDPAGSYRLRLSKATVDRLYTFQGRVQRIIDGDTLVAMIDQGFGVWTSQKLRLKGLDAPEADTQAGRKAKAWVEEELAKVPFVVIRTTRSDKYDRYLADIFYLEGEDDAQRVAGEGRWLNGGLLTAGLAAAWK